MKERLDQIKRDIREANKNFKKASHPNVKALYERQANQLLAYMAAIKLEIRRDKLIKRVEATGITFAHWLAWAESQYDIKVNTPMSPPFTVKSKAREWNVDMSWNFDDHVSCLEKVEQLVGYKIYDRKRDRGSMEQDLNA